MRKSLLSIAFAIAACAQSARAEEWVVEAHYPDRAALARAAARFQHVQVDAQREVIRVDTDEHGIAMLQREGFTVSIDAAATAGLRGVYATMQAARESGVPTLSATGYPSIPGFACYRTVEGTYQTMDDLVTAHAGIAQIDTIGPTWKKTQNAAQGYEMRALRITNLSTAAADPERPRMVVFSSIHAREYAPAEIDTRFAEWLLSGYGTDAEATWLVDHNDFRLILQANPDGRKIAETQVYQRKNMNVVDAPCADETAYSQPGVDLNRNFPFHWNIVPDDGGSSSYVCEQTFRGPLKTSEPETQNLVAYVAGQCDAAGVCSGGVFADRRSGPMNPTTVEGDGGAAAPDDTRGMFFDIHSAASLVMWPWGDTPDAAPNGDALRRLGRRLAWFNDYTPEQSDTLYPTDGATDDTMYGLLGVPAFTFETDDTFFQDCGSFESDTAPKNILALRYAARALHAPYTLPGGPDAYGLAVSAVQNGASGPSLTLTATIGDAHYNQSNGNEATFPIRAAYAYIDRLPWEPSATPIALSATDGHFDSTTEAVSGSIDLSGLPPGKHLLYVQGVNARSVPRPADTIFVDGFEGTAAPAGTAGTPNAVFFEIAP